jgi:hypothetical protein
MGSDQPATFDLLEHNQDSIVHGHAGGHGTFPSDWDYHLKFMDMHLLQK